MGNKESNESAAVKRQAEGFSNPMYRMLDLGVSSSDLQDKLCCEAIFCLLGRWLVSRALKKGYVDGKHSRVG
mgnify:FL=1